MAMGWGASFQFVDIAGANVVGDLGISGASFSGDLTATLSNVGGDLYMGGGSEHQFVNLSGARIGGHLGLNGGTFQGLDFSNGSADELVLSNSRWDDDGAQVLDDATWVSEGGITLRNASVSAVQSRPSAWQRSDGSWIDADLTGFSYQRLAGFGAAAANTLIDEPADRMIAWLAGVTEEKTAYDPQPYEQLSSVLATAGMSDKAKAVRYAKFLHRDEMQPGTWLEAAFIRPASRILVGYGVYPFRALGWFAVLVALGFLAGFFSKADLMAPNYRKFWYSLENALPLVESTEAYRVIEHDNRWVESYFHFQRVAGFVLGTVLVGALSLLPG